MVRSLAFLRESEGPLAQGRSGKKLDGRNPGAGQVDSAKRSQQVYCCKKEVRCRSSEILRVRSLSVAQASDTYCGPVSQLARAECTGSRQGRGEQKAVEKAVLVE